MDSSLTSTIAWDAPSPIERIPKRIHYIWFGGNPLGELERACITSWETHCPDYEIVRWDESNFNVRVCSYISEAYDAGKWAFVSDFARLWVLVNYGGIYLDTDVELLRPLDAFLSHEAFSGFETDASVSTGILACEKGSPLFKALLNDYSSRHFKRDDGSFDMTTNVKVITDELLTRGLKPNGRYQVVEGLTLYPTEWFSPKDQETGEIRSSEHTCAIHHFGGSWLSPADREVRETIQKLQREHPEIGSRRAEVLSKLIYCLRHHDLSLARQALRRKLGNR